MHLMNDIEKILITKEEISSRVAKMGERISEDFKDENELLLIGVLRGASIFLADISRQISLPVHMSFMALSSYHMGTQSTGAVRIDYDTDEDISGKTVIIIEDIIDSGLTLKYLCEILKARNPKTLKTCCLLDKPSRRKVDFKADYVGFEIEDEFVVGYGLDYAQKYRNFEFLAALKREVYE